MCPHFHPLRTPPHRQLLEKLNIQAYAHALSKYDEFIMELVNTEDKVPVLVHELLLVEVRSPCSLSYVCVCVCDSSTHIHLSVRFTLIPHTPGLETQRLPSATPQAD
jgi:hypothetical protein